MTMQTSGTPFGADPLDRRSFNKALAAAGLGLAVLPLAPRPARAAGKITYLTWSGYELDDFNRSFVAKYGGPPEVSFFADQEEALQKVRAGFQPDIAHPCSETVLRWRMADLVKPFDTARLAAWGDVWPNLKGLKNTTDESGNVYFVPWEWGNSSVLYRTDLVDIKEESWSLLFDERYKGQLSMYNEAAASVEVAAQTLGYDNIFSLNDAQLAEVRKLLVKQRDLLRFHWNSQSEIEQALAAGEIVAAYAWNDAVVNLKKQGVPVKYMNPKEGIRTWVCGFILPNVGKGDEQAAYDFINSRLEPETGVEVINQFGYGHANRKAFDLVPRATVEALGIEDPDALLARSIFLQGEDPPYDEIYIKLFEEVKAGL